ncbi:TECPR [Seminavis robusta]|uniref:TECPR n=1 Tax=Seminavis robusta TaxID=568900 RepID=A0A9N8HUG4_9STRA|nr:TECPR [Seminavis robusta]|eukprot:Sro1651_g288760.1 TECPR (1655) ;mRNA; r:18414-23920
MTPPSTFGIRTFLSLLTVFVVTKSCSAAPATDVTSEKAAYINDDPNVIFADDKNHVDDSLSRLRGSSNGQALQEIQTEVSANLAKMRSPGSIGLLPYNERADIMVGLQKSVSNVVLYLADLDWKSLPIEEPQQAELHGQLTEAVNDSNNAMEKAIEFVRQAFEGGDSGPEMNAPPKQKQNQRRAKEKSSEEDNQSSSNNENSGRYSQGHRSSFPGSFYKKFHRMMDATTLRPGSKAHISKMLGKHDGAFASNHAHGSRHGRHLQQDSREAMCAQLVECVLSMSRYDTFVYFYSDDINPASGSVDDQRIVFDEEDLIAKYNSAQEKANEILSNGYDSSPGYCEGNIQTHESGGKCCHSSCGQCGGYGCNTWGDSGHNCCMGHVVRECTGPEDTECVIPSEDNCDQLLQMFHRTVENGEVPKWEGGTVGQVCLAEGTPAYVDLGDAAAASVDTSTFREKAWETVEQRIESGQASEQWADTGIEFSRVSVASDGTAWGISPSGQIYIRGNGGNEWYSRPLYPPTTYLMEVSVASTTQVGLDSNGELFKASTYNSDYMEKISGPYKADQVSVGVDGTVWGMRTYSSQTNKLCKRAGVGWTCDFCEKDFKSVHVGSKDHIYFLEHDTDDIYKYTGGWCETTKLYGAARWLSVSVDDDGNERGVYIVGNSNNHIYVLNKDKDISWGASNSPWNKLQEISGGFDRVSSSGDGVLWATTQNGRMCEWKADNNGDFWNWDTWNWGVDSISSAGKNHFHCGASETWKSVSVARNGEICGFKGSYVVYCKWKVGQSYTLWTSQDGIGLWTTFQHMDIGVSRRNMYVSGNNADIQRRKQRGWESFANLPKAMMHVSVTDDGSWVWAVDVDGNVWRVSSEVSGDFESLPGRQTEIAAISKHEVWAVNGYGTLYHTTNSGGTWTEIEKPHGVSMKRISAASDGSVWAIDAGNTIYRFDENLSNSGGSGWINENGGFTFFDVAVGSQGDVVAVSHGSTRQYTGIDVHFGYLSNSFGNAVRTFAEEALDCAKDLFFENSVRSNSFVTYEASGTGSVREWELEPFVFGIGGTEPSDINGYRIPVSVDFFGSASSGRDKHGHLISNTVPGFVFKKYTDLIAEYNICASGLVTQFDTTLTEALNNETVTDATIGKDVFDGKMDEFVDDLGKDCISPMFDQIGAGLELVFGEKPSPGFICGMKGAIISQESIMPGYCCLDAPYELQGDAWGHPYDCSTATHCQNVGPYFSGMSVEACDAQGGTWCPQPSDCGVLMTCIQNEINDASSSVAYKEYLRLAPNVAITTDSIQCGRARQYFGYDARFLNDQAICDDIHELRLSKDFSFMDEFLGGQADGGGTAPGNTTGDYTELNIAPLTIIEIAPPPVPDFKLGKVNYTHSGLMKQTKGQGWRATNFALRTALGVVYFVRGILDSAACPETGCTPVDIGLANLCQAAHFAASSAVEVAAHIINVALDISEFTYEEAMEQGNNEPWQIFDRVKAIKHNMDLTGEYIQHRFEQQNNFIQAHHVAMSNMLYEHQDSIGGNLTLHHSLHAITQEKVNQTYDQVVALDAKITELQCANSFDLQVEIVSVAPKQVLVLTTFEGALTDYTTLIIKGVEGGMFVSVTPTVLGLETGRAILELSGTTATAFTFDAKLTTNDKVYVQSTLASFGALC